MIPTSHGTEQSSPISAQGRPETGILLERPPQMSSVREGLPETQIPLPSLLMTYLEVAFQCHEHSLLHRVQLQLHKNERIFIINTTTACSQQPWGRNPGTKGWWMKSFTCTINILFHFIKIIKKILHIYPNYALNADTKSDLQQESFRRISFILKKE